MRRVLVLALLALAGAALGCPVASAAPVTFNVQNQRGIAQAGTKVMPAPDGPTTAWTNGHGQVSLDVSPGQNLYFQRGLYPSSHVCAAPEGAGVNYRVPATPVNATITLPNGNGELHAPANSSDERWMVGRINQERASLGRPPLYISLTINEAADRYSNYLALSGAFEHCAIADPLVRMLDSGWPIRNGSGAEALVFGTTLAPKAFDLWMNSPPHRAVLTSASYGSIGMAEVNGFWTADLGAPCPGSIQASERCRMTLDDGNPNLSLRGDDKALKRAIKKCKKKKRKKARRRCVNRAKKKVH